MMHNQIANLKAALCGIQGLALWPYRIFRLISCYSPNQILSNIQRLLSSNLQSSLRNMLFAHTAPSAWNEGGQSVRTDVKSVAF